MGDYLNMNRISWNNLIPCLFNMEDSIDLYSFENEDIRISIVARFENEDLIIDGYDIGKSVKNYWGDSDYEYMITVKKEDIQSLYTALNIETGNKASLLKALAKRFHGNHCFSEIREFLDLNNIKCEGFSWI